jgi:hypothetical protein
MPGGSWEEWAPYGVGEPDADGVFPDYRVPAHLRRPAPAATEPSGPLVWWSTIAAHWDLVVCDLTAIHGVDLHHPGTLERPWPGVRTLILGLLQEPTSRLRRVLREEAETDGPDRR